MSYLIGNTETKVFLQLTGTASDVLVNLYIDMIEAEISAYVGRPLGRATYTEVLNYLQSKFDRSSYTNLDAFQPAPNLFLKNYPIVTGTVVIMSGDTTYSDTAYSVNYDNGVISTDTFLGNVQHTLIGFPYQPTATYVAGYTTATAPNDLKAVAYLGVKSLYDNNGPASNTNGDVKSKSVEGFSVSYGNEQTGYIGSTTKAGTTTLAKTYIASNTITLNRYKKITV